MWVRGLDLKRPAGVVFLAIALFTEGCAHPGFIIGIYDAPQDALPRLHEAGFNLVTGGRETNRSAFLRAAKTNHIKVILAPRLGTEMQRAETAQLDKHPALAAWYLSDEPDLNTISPEELKKSRSDLRKVARKPVYITLASGAAIERYRESAQILAVDWYPVPWSPLATISREMRSARLASRGRPFLAILQAFDWRAYPDLIKGDVPLRAPTAAELRCMAYLSLFQGASGLLFYTYNSEKWKIAEQPVMWSALTNLVAEIKETAPLFEERVKWWPIQTNYRVDGEMFNQIHEGSIALNVFRLRTATASFAAGDYVVAINTTDRAVQFDFREPVGDGRWIARNYDPFEIFIHGPLPTPLATKRLP